MKFKFLILTLSILFIHCDTDHPDPKRNGALDGLQLASYQRAYPKADIPSQGYYQAYEYTQKNLKKDYKDATVDPWESQGPWNVAGRILSLAIDPFQDSTIYAGSASGGIWKSERMGLDTSWVHLDTGFPVLGVSAIAVNPLNSNDIHIGTGEVYNYERTGQDAAYRVTRGSYGIGILRSTDGGQTWRKTLDWSYNQRTGVNAITYDPQNPNNLYAATSEGIFKSIDSGNSWTKSLDVVMCMDVAIDPNQSNILIASAGNFNSDGKGIYRTEDGGATWEKITENIPASFNGKIRLDVHPIHSHIMFASIGNGFGFSDGASWLMRSDDRGKTWELRSTADYSKWQGWFAHDVATNPVDTNGLIVIGIESWTSNNGGRVIQRRNNGGNVLGRPEVGSPEGNGRYVHSDQHVALFHPRLPNVALLGTDGGVFITEDAGSNYQSRNGGLQTTQFYPGTSLVTDDEFKSTTKFMGGLQDNSTVIYRGDKAWEKVFGGDGSWTAIHPEEPDILFASSQRLNIGRSSNDGVSFGGVGNFSSDDPLFIAPYVMALSDPNIMYAGATRVHRSTNNGRSWAQTNNGQRLNGDPVFSMDVSATNANVVYVGTAPFDNKPAVFVTLNGGNTWADITGNLPDRFPNDIVIDPNDESVAYVCFSGFGTSHLYKTSNYGETWEDISLALPDVPGNAIAVDPQNSNFLYYGTDLGVFFSGDGGLNWETFHDGLPTAVIAMDIKMGASDKVWVATHGNGVYARDKVLNFTSDGLQVVDASRVHLMPNPVIDILRYTIEGDDFDPTKIEVVDLHGKLVISKTFQGRLGTVDVTNLVSGTYVARFYEDDRVALKKFVKM